MRHNDVYFYISCYFKNHHLLLNINMIKIQHLHKINMISQIFCYAKKEKGSCLTKSFPVLSVA